ncbi:MAG: Asp-tRNA(Asn)/Glu-tRNA(Gln) amidotransferase subunit GatA [Gammaproteobacteria bacterium]|nr:Asp-tRNA(Asn)/Glu-tRNA(Gln) amidotransferase subunit GatA [Gammaproteobacteria bacterium]MYF57969.1 Asp-tRNA(Asn)/Glu-tRNA(Gln) amidotransferase subunit GatA [Gammaproteobacteria bacterium]
MIEFSLSGLRRALDSGDIGSVELTQACLDRIEDRNPELNAFLTVCGDSALDGARRADAGRANGGALAGIPIAHKDIFCTRGVRTTAGSGILDNFLPPYDATVVERLAEAGALLIGKTNMDEFAMGSSNETSYAGPVRNPWDLSRSPGGSSGGSAAAVAAGLVPAATGTDTGGSVRQPAALCGLTGFRPSYGRVSRYGMIAFASSLDQAGSITRTAEDAALLLDSMAGHDPRDSTCAERDGEDYSGPLQDLQGKALKGVRVGIVREFMDEGLDARCRQVFVDNMETLRGLGAVVTEVSLPRLPLSVPVYYVVAPAECSSNLSRFDGVRFGLREAGADSLEELYTRTRRAGFGEEVRRRILVGGWVLSKGYFDAYYLQAQRVRRLVADDFSKAFETVDLLAGPTAPAPAFGIGEKIDDPIQMYLNDIYTIGASLAGIPAISIPAGTVDGLPVGLQLMGRPFAEADVLRAAHAYQLETDWHRLWPPGMSAPC